MAFNLLAKRNSISNFLSKNNTTTSSNDISSGLSERVVTFKKGVRNSWTKTPIISSNLPAVFVEASVKSEEITTLGRQASREITADFDIVCIVDYGLGQTAGRNESDDEILTLVQNIEDLIRADMQMSNTLLYIDEIATDLSVEENEDTYVSIAKIIISTVYMT